MHEINNPLESLTNLVYLAKKSEGASTDVLQYMELAETQLLQLGAIAGKTLSFYREQTEAREFDLVDIAESALKIHAHRAKKQDVAIGIIAKAP